MKATQCSSMDEWMKKCDIHTVWYLFNLIKWGNSETLKHGWTSHKITNAIWFHLYKFPGVVKLIETDSRTVVTSSLG